MVFFKYVISTGLWCLATYSCMVSLNKYVYIIICIWLGSAREHFNQMEIQLAQMKRLHQVQDEYVQCLARNDELLLSQGNDMQVWSISLTCTV